jgi:hypothetical protein
MLGFGKVLNPLIGKWLHQLGILEFTESLVFGTSAMFSLFFFAGADDRGNVSVSVGGLALGFLFCAVIIKPRVKLLLKLSGKVV